MKRSQLYWLIIIFVLILFLGLGLFYTYRILTTSVSTKFPIPLVAPLEGPMEALLKAFDSCVQSIGENTNTGRMKELLSPFGEIVGRVHPWNWVKAADGGLRACLFVVKEEETIGTFYFVVTSPERRLDVATIQYNR